MTRTYYEQHHELEAPAVDGHAFRPYWRRRTRLETLVADRAISRRVYLAAVVYRQLVESASSTAWRARTEAFAPIDRTVARVGNSGVGSRVDMIRRAVGPFAARLLDLVIVSDLSWAELGRCYSVDPKTARKWAITTLQILPSLVFR